MSETSARRMKNVDLIKQGGYRIALKLGRKTLTKRTKATNSKEMLG